MPFVTYTQTDLPAVYLKFLQISIFLEITYNDLVNLGHSVCITYGLVPVLSNY